MVPNPKVENIPKIIDMMKYPKIKSTEPKNNESFDKILASNVLQ